MIRHLSYNENLVREYLKPKGGYRVCYILVGRLSYTLTMAKFPISRCFSFISVFKQNNCSKLQTHVGLPNPFPHCNLMKLV